MRLSFWSCMLAVCISVASFSAGAKPPSTQISEQDVSDAYIYLLARLLVTRQQQLDFKEGFVWNEVIHRKPGEVDWPNPNLDVAYSEAWATIDSKSCLSVTVPEITGRYYTVQFLNGWGETVANINERTFPNHPHGEFAVCLKEAKATFPKTVQRIDVPTKDMRVLFRVELGSDWDGAIALQHKFKISPTGKPQLPTVPKTPIFELSQLPGVEAFEAATVALGSAPDINPGMAQLQTNVRAIAKAIKAPEERKRIDQLIHTRVFGDIAKYVPKVGHGTFGNNWALPATSGSYGDDWLTRTLVNYAGIWANVREEVVYYKGFRDGAGTQLQSDHTYTLTFPKDALPPSYVKYFWSVIAVDATNKRVLPNPMKRYLLSNQSKLAYGNDGSLTLYFAPEKPANAPEGNWLPTPKGQAYNLTFRFYGPLGDVASRKYYPPPLVRVP
jgi:hypothetical protein